jgi:hypothetical protein
MEWHWKEEIQLLGENPVPSTTMYTTNSTWTGLEENAIFRVWSQVCTCEIWLSVFPHYDHWPRKRYNILIVTFWALGFVVSRLTAVQCKSYNWTPIRAHKTWFPLAQISMSEHLLFCHFCYFAVSKSVVFMEIQILYTFTFSDQISYFLCLSWLLTKEYDVWVYLLPPYG